MNKPLSRSEMQAKLREGTCFVVFLKKNGTKRTMLCTLEEGEYEEPKGTGSGIQSLDVLPVYDIEAQGWRSFRVDSVLVFESVSSEE
jgi:hypothetical protein